MPFGEGRLTQALGRELTRMTGVRLDEDSWDQVSLEDHLLMRIRVVDEDGRELASGRDYGALCQRMAGQLSDQRVSAPVAARSEEHTSELQSRPHLVCRL